MKMKELGLQGTGREGRGRSLATKAGRGSGRCVIVGHRLGCRHLQEVVPGSCSPSGAGGAPARGAEVTRVVSAMDGDNRFDFNLTASWIHDVKSAFVKRELQSAVAASTELIKDSMFSQTRDILEPARRLRHPLGRRPARRAAAGPAGHVAASTSIASAGSSCIYPGGRRPAGPPASTRHNSTDPARRHPARVPGRTAGAWTPSTTASTRAPPGDGARPGEPVSGPDAQGLRVPGRRRHLGGRSTSGATTPSRPGR